MDSQINHIHRGSVSFSVALLALVFALCGGCSSGNSAKVIFQSVDSSKLYSQTFGRAYFSRSESGEYEVALIEDGISPAPSKSSGPIPPSSAAPLSQYLQIRILWKPLHGAKPDTPSATNAIIDWYVRSNESPDHRDRLHYRGAGFVSVYDSGDSAIFDIRSSRLELSETKGQLQDPLGTSNVTGYFTAILNRAMVASTIQSLRDAPESPQPMQTGAHEGPPSRPVAGP